MEKDLKEFELNILNWYEFDFSESILQIGGNSSIYEFLKLKFKNVEFITDVNDAKFDKKFNYILIFDIENLSKIENKILKLIYDDGKILIIGDNQFGISNFSKFKYTENSEKQVIENYNNKFESILNIKNSLKYLGFNINFYSVFPNYKKPELIFNENFNISKNQIEKYTPLFNEKEVKVFNEVGILKNFVLNDRELVFKLCNSYFIEASKQNKLCDIKYVSFNNVRKEKFRLITLIKEDYVEKKIVNINSKEHLEQIKYNIKDLQEKGYNILDYSENNRIYSKYIKNERTLDEILSKENKEFVLNILNKFKEKFIENSVTYDECKDKIDYCNDEKILKNLHFLKKAYWDLIPKNCFYLNEKFYFFDQEWEKDYLPAEFLVYRSLVNSYDLVRKINVDEYLKELGILEYKELFIKIDEKLRNEIIDKDIYKIVYEQKVKSVDNFINENKSYLSELDRKQTYIDNLEKNIEDLKLKNEKLQKDYEELKIINDNRLINRIKRFIRR